MTYPYCRTCHRPMRPNRTTSVEHPGTVRIANTDLCQSCYSRERRGLTGPARSIRNPADVIEDVTWLLGTDHPINIARRLGYSDVDYLRVALRRAGRDDLADQLTVREAA